MELVKNLVLDGANMDILPSRIAPHDVAKDRLEDTEFQLMKDRVLDDDFIESVEEDEELSEDDLVLV